MYLNKTWRILTIGDGDLSFSYSLLADHEIMHISATVLDDRATLTSKYAENALSKLRKHNVALFFGVNVLAAESFADKLKHQFDLVIFQFPLIPQYADQQDYEHHRHLGNNLLNRNLIYQFLEQSFSYFCDPSGACLAYVTSKNVKPYSHWNIENLYEKNGFQFLGEMPFQINAFPQYRLRNVDRDKTVKSTESITYVWGRRAPEPLQSKLVVSKKYLPEHCTLCGKGPLSSETERMAHERSAMHVKLANYEIAWQQAKKNGLIN